MEPQRGLCRKCQKPLGGEKYWIIDYPDGVHEKCRDWQGAPFPFDGDLSELRRLAHLVARMHRETVSLGKWLVAARGHWPDRAQDMVDEFRRRKSRYRDQLAQVKNRLKIDV